MANMDLAPVEFHQFIALPVDWLACWITML